MNVYKIHSLFLLTIFGLVVIGCSNRPPIVMETDRDVITHLPELPLETIEPEDHFQSTHPPYPVPYPYPIVTSTPPPFQAPPYPPPAEEAKQGELPNLPAELLFMDGQSLVYWPRDAHSLETIAGPEQAELGPVFMYAFNNWTRDLALVVKESSQGFKIIHLNIDSRERTLLVNTANNVPLKMSFSPDGNWLAYILPDISPEVHCRLENIQPEADPVFIGEDCGETIYFLPVSSPEQVRTIGACAEKIFTDDYSNKTVCNSFVWSSDSQSLYWGDVYGLWRMDIIGEAPVLINASKRQQFLPDTEVYEFYQFSDWSPDGRYLTLEIQYMESWGWAVLDALEGSVYTLPGIWPSPFQRLTWLQDGSLLSVQPYTMTNNVSLTGIIWQMGAETLPGPVQVTEFPLPFPVSPIVNFPLAPHQWPDGRVGFAIANMFGSEYHQRGLYFLNLADFTFQKANGLPTSALSIYANIFSYNEPIYWAPNGAGAIYNYYYIPSDGSPIYFLGSLFREKVNDFTWITP